MLKCIWFILNIKHTVGIKNLSLGVLNVLPDFNPTSSVWIKPSYFDYNI